MYIFITVTLLKHGTRALYLLPGQSANIGGFKSKIFLNSKSRKTFIFGVTTSTTLELKFHNLSIEIGRLSYKWQ